MGAHRFEEPGAGRGLDDAPHDSVIGLGFITLHLHSQIRPADIEKGGCETVAFELFFLGFLSRRGTVGLLNLVDPTVEVLPGRSTHRTEDREFRRPSFPGKGELTDSHARGRLRGLPFFRDQEVKGSSTQAVGRLLDAKTFPRLQGEGFSGGRSRFGNRLALGALHLRPLLLVTGAQISGIRSLGRRVGTVRMRGRRFGRGLFDHNFFRLRALAATGDDCSGKQDGE